jgi:ABC-type antimicrobial peptide transport system permease subunit
MCLCVFFIMRSSFMSRVREVGILRAIGVTKKNLTFRFAVETALLLLLTVVPGYALSSWFIGSMSDAAFISEMFFFPLWIALPLFAVILTVSMVFGVLPALTLLRKTPSEILSKYDI